MLAAPILTSTWSYSDLPKTTEIDVKRSLCQICRAPGNFYWRNGPLRVLCTEHEDERCAIEFFSETA